MYNVKDITAAWSLHWFQIVSNLAHCQQDQQDRTRTSWNSQHSSKWLKFSKPQRSPFPSKHCTSYLVSPLEFAGASQAWHQVGRLRLWAWDKTGLITVRVHPLSSMIIYWDLPPKSRVAVPALSHKSHLVNWAVPGCRDPRQARVPQSTTTTMPAMIFAWKLTRQKAGRNRTAS